MLRSLLDLPYDKRSDSTRGMQLRMAMASVQPDGKWKLIEGDTITALRDLIASTLLRRSSSSPSADAAADDSPLEQQEVSKILFTSSLLCRSSSSPSADAAADDSPLEQQEVSKILFTSSLLPEPFSQTSNQDGSTMNYQEAASSACIAETADCKISNLVEAVLELSLPDGDFHVLEDFALLSTIDLAGQQVYQCLQPLFTSPNSAFAICFDSSKGIDEKVRNDVFDANGHSHRLVTLADGQTQFEKMLAWLDIYFHDGQSRFKGDDNCALLVGCKDDLRRSRPRPTGEIRDRLESTRFNDVVHGNIFYVDNTKSGTKTRDKGVKALRKKINSMAKKQANIPVLWLRFTISLRLWRQKSRQPWMQKTEATKLALSLKSITSEGQMDSLLHYHHQMGQLAYFPDSNLKDILILDLQYVVDATNALLDPDKDLPADLKRRLDTGFISEKTVMSCFNRYFNDQPEKREMQNDSAHLNYLLALLQHLLVVMEVGTGDCGSPLLSTLARPKVERVFVCPAAAKDYSSTRTPSMYETSPRICFPIAGDGHFPPYLYWQVVLSSIEMVRRHGEDVADVELTLSRARIPWRANTNCWLYLHHGKNGLVVSAEQYKSSDGAAVWPSGVDTGPEALSAIRGCLCKVMERDKHNRLELEVAVPCKCGSNEHMECFLHGIRYCSNKACFHTCKLKTTPGLVPKCPVSKEPQVVRDCLIFWLQYDQVRYVGVFLQ